MRNLHDHELYILVENVNSIRKQLINELTRRIPSFTIEDCNNLTVDELRDEVEKLISVKKGS